MKPTNKTYEIRTLADIYNLPSHEAVETCLKEISVLILQTRATNDLLANAAKNMGLPTDAICIPFLEKVEWIDMAKESWMLLTLAKAREIPCCKRRLS